ncbi:MAG TPA: aldo/keto reductase [Burkholderiales bacterium]|nr:aldo/keto reductase [Burkholderiales bacterium]
MDSVGPTRRTLGRSGIAIGPLVFGGNVFGWTVDEATGHALLDRFFAAGLNAIDTADVYSKWAPGNRGGESEAMIGRWLARSSARREEVVLITKVGSEIAPGRKGLSRRHILQAVDDSLRRLQTDHIDVYLAHRPDGDTPIEETLAAFDTLLKAGKVRAIGGSNYDAAGLRAALAVSAERGLPRYEVLQPEYNLYDRASFDGALRELCTAEGIGVITYYSLASGFLSGKYRSKADLGKSPRGQGVAKYLDERGRRILAALDTVGERHKATPAEVALAWLVQRPGVTAPIASATRLEQLESLIRATRLPLAAVDIELLDAASAR